MDNFKNIKVSKALKKGFDWINVPCYAFLFFFMFIIPSLLIYIFSNDQNNPIFITSVIISFILSFSLPFFWYFITVVKYKIWASKNVNDIHRFYEEAKSKKLIYETNLFRSLEIKSKTQKIELDKFYERINSEKKIVIDINPEIESDTYFKKSYKINIILFSVLTILFFLLQIDNGFSNKLMLKISIILVAFLAYEIYKSIKNNNNFTLKINRDYISYKNDELKIFWVDIISYDTTINFGTTAGHMTAKPKLIILTKTGNQILELEGFTKWQLNKIINVLNENKHRFEVKNQTL